MDGGEAVAGQAALGCAQGAVKLGAEPGQERLPVGRQLETLVGLFAGLLPVAIVIDQVPERDMVFFRADSQAKVIVYAWVNDRDTLRKAGAGTDPYAVFARMLASGNPPGDWPALLATAADPDAERRFAAADKES